MAGETILSPIPSVAVTLPTRVLATPFQFATTGADNLRLRAWYLNGILAGNPPNGVTIAVRQILNDGSIQITNTSLTPSNDGTTNTLLIPLAAGFIQTCTVNWTGPSILQGLCYVTVDLVRGTNPAAVTQVGQLIGGYIRPGGGQAWPGSPITQSIEGRGFQRRVLPDVIVGAGDVAWTQPHGTRWRVVAADAVLVTSAAAGNRVSQLVLCDAGGGPQRLRFPAPLLIAPSSSGAVSWFAGGSSGAIAAVSETVSAIAAELITTGLNTGWRTITLNMDAANDQYTEAWLFIEEWLEANLP